MVRALTVKDKGKQWFINKTKHPGIIVLHN